MGLIQRIITLLISNWKNTDFESNSSSKCLHSKTFSPRLKFPNRSKVIIETVTEGHFSTHFISDYVSWITSHFRLFYTKFNFKIINVAIWEKYFQAKCVCESFDFHLYVPPSAHNSIPYYWKHGGTDSNDNNSLDFHRKNTKFVIKFNMGMFTF